MTQSAAEYSADWHNKYRSHYYIGPRIQQLACETPKMSVNNPGPKNTFHSTCPLLPGDIWAGAGLQGALGFELSPLVARAPIRFGLEPGLGRHCGLRYPERFVCCSWKTSTWISRCNKWRSVSNRHSINQSIQRSLRLAGCRANHVLCYLSSVAADIVVAGDWFDNLYYNWRCRHRYRRPHLHHAKLVAAAAVVDMTMYPSQGPMMSL